MWAGLDLAALATADYLDAVWVTLHRDPKIGARVEAFLEDLGVQLELAQDMRAPDEATWGLSAVAIEGTQAAMNLGGEQ